jgi:uracil-DNA glycosylase
VFPVLAAAGYAIPRPRPAFAHGGEFTISRGTAVGDVLLLGCYHPSQQNTFTGRVTPDMLDSVFTRARSHAIPHT